MEPFIAILGLTKQLLLGFVLGAGLLFAAVGLLGMWEIDPSMSSAYRALAAVVCPIVGVIVAAVFGALHLVSDRPR